MKGSKCTLTLYKELAKLGEVNNRDKIVEECAELIEELENIIALMKTGVDNKGLLCKSFCRAYGEIADVIVSTERYLMNTNAYDYIGLAVQAKRDRTRRRLANGELN